MTGNPDIFGWSTWSPPNDVLRCETSERIMVQADRQSHWDEWSPTRRWAVWHDRAVFHFLTEAEDRRRYRDLLRRSVEPGGSVLIATFAEHGPTSCSGLPVERYSADRLLTEIGPGFTGTGQGRFEHTTPSGATQPLIWVTARAA